MFNYLLYRVFIYFHARGGEKAVGRTVNFLVLLEGSLIVPLFILLNNLEKKWETIFSTDSHLKYYVGIPLFELLILLHSAILKKKLQGVSLAWLKNRYNKEKYSLPIGVIFAAPLFFIFIFPMAFNGQGSLQFIESFLFEMP